MAFPNLNSEVRRLLFASSSQGLLLLDAEGRVVEGNAIAAGLLRPDPKCDVEDLLGKPLQAFSDMALPDGILERALTEPGVWSRFTWTVDAEFDGESNPLGFQISGLQANGEKLVLARLQEESETPGDSEEMGDESFLQRALDSIPIAVFWKDRDLRFLGCNASFAADAGYESPAGLIGKTDEDMPWDKEHTEGYLREDRRILDGGEDETRITERRRRAEGSDAWVETRKVPIHNAEGEVIGILGSYEDVTERKLAEESLQEFSDGLRLMSQSTADKSGQQFFDSCAVALAQLLEVPIAIIGVIDPLEKWSLRPMSFWRIDQLVKCESIDLSDTPLVEVERTKGTVCVPAEVREYHPGNDFLNELKAESFVGLPITRENGEICGYFCGVDWNAKEGSLEQVELIMNLFAGRISVELERCKAMDFLERKVERASLLEGISRQIRASFDPDEIVQSAISGLGSGMSADRCIIFSYHSAPRPELVVTSEHVVDGVDSVGDTEIGVDGNPFIEGLLEEDTVMVSNHVYQDALLTTSREQLRKQGVQSILAVRTSYQNEVNGALMLHQCQDVRLWTKEDEDLLKAVADMVGIALGQAKMFENERLQRHELARKNRALAKAKADADAANHAKSEFLSRMSHELRTPLNAILGFSQVMARDSLATEQQRQNLDTITRSGTHLLEMINDVLEMSRIEAGEVTVDPTTFNLEDLLDSVVSMFQTRAHPSVRLKLGIAPTVPVYARTDAVKLRQILINLFGNAVKFTTEGEVSLRVRAEQRYPDGISSAWSLIASVCDTGPGIHEKEMDRIFQPFSQTETGQRLQGGTGLGLPISRQFARLLGGDISVESRYGEGTIVTLKIPCGEANPGELDDRRLALNQRVAGLAAGQQAPRVLIVDDHEESRTWMAMLLSSLGLDPVTAENGAEGLEKCEAHKPRVVFMDIHMPVMNGNTAAKEIRHRHADDPPLLVALTASAFVEETERVTEGPFDLFLAKPVHEKSLVEVFEAHLGVVFDYGAEVVRSDSELPPANAPSAQKKEKSEPPVDQSECSPIASMPASWLDRMADATNCLNLGETQELLREFEKKHPKSAAPLLQWCEDYRFDKLQEELREARESGYATK